MELCTEVSLLVGKKKIIWKKYLKREIALFGLFVVFSRRGTSDDHLSRSIRGIVWKHRRSKYGENYFVLVTILKSSILILKVPEI